MDYATCVWGDSFIGHSNTTFRLEKRAARKIMDAPWDAPSTALLSDINIHYVSCVPCGTCGLCVPYVPFSVEPVFPFAPVSLASPAGVFRGARFSSLEGEKRAPLKTPEWEATVSPVSPASPVSPVSPGAPVLSGLVMSCPRKRNPRLLVVKHLRYHWIRKKVILPRQFNHLTNDKWPKTETNTIGLKSFLLHSLCQLALQKLESPFPANNKYN